MQGDRGWAALDGRDNALNAIRLALALAVLASHAMILADNRVTLAPHQIGATAVAGFFAISGYLIAGSRERLSLGPFLWRRVLRLMPAYWVMLVVTAFVFAPLVGGWDTASALNYVAHNAGLVQLETGIGDTLHHPGWVASGIWNWSLWTLPFEFGAYLALGVVFRVRVMRRPTSVAVVFVALAVVAWFQWNDANLYWSNPSISRLGLSFTAGVLLHQLRDRLPYSVMLACLSGIVVALCCAAGLAPLFVIAPLPLAYALLWLGARLPTRLGSRNDISYGVYIYGHPVQQVAMTAGTGALGFGGLTLLSLVAVVPLAWASWLVVERPAMKLRLPIRVTQGQARRRGPTTLRPRRSSV